MPPNLIGFSWVESDLSSRTRAGEIWDLQNCWNRFSFPSIIHFIHMCFNILQVYLKVKEPVFHQVILKNYYTFDCLTILACLVFSFFWQITCRYNFWKWNGRCPKKTLFKTEVANLSAYRSQVEVTGIYLEQPMPRTSWLLVVRMQCSIVLISKKKKSQEALCTYTYKVFFMIWFSWKDRLKIPWIFSS